MAPPAKRRLKGRSALMRHNLEVGIMNPTPLVPGAGKDLIDGLPEAECAVADGEIRRDLEATSLDVDEKFGPALRPLSHLGLRSRRVPSCPRVWRRSAQACIRRCLPFALVGRPVRPYIHVTPRRASNQPATAPAVITRLTRLAGGINRSTCAHSAWVRLLGFSGDRGYTLPRFCPSTMKASLE
jgi:hypothetical protein